MQQRLREIGCDEVQGYLLARPMSGDDVDPWLYAQALTRRPVPTQRTSADAHPRTPA